MRLHCRVPNGTQLFRDLSLSMGPARDGLVGRNGSGTSRLLGGERWPKTGTVSLLARAWRVGQEIDPILERIADALGVGPAVAALARLAAEADWSVKPRLAKALAAVSLAGPDLGHGRSGPPRDPGAAPAPRP
jgi:ATPase subunit of ABC transporter with duplicated ATPase domains